MDAGVGLDTKTEKKNLLPLLGIEFEVLGDPSCNLIAMLAEVSHLPPDVK
jgi:hypothetical protein